jgi:putative transposase
MLQGAVSKDHVHMPIEYPPSKSISDLIKRLKGRTSRWLQQEIRETPSERLLGWTQK